MNNGDELEINSYKWKQSENKKKINKEFISVTFLNFKL